MVVEVSNNTISDNTISTKNTGIVSTHVNFKANPNNTLERTPNTDSLNLSSKDKNLKIQNILLTICGLAIATTCAICGIKKHKTNKALKEIETKFAELEKDLPKAQKTFKEVFLRDDLTEKEVQEMLNRYKEIERLGITENKEKYINAMFKEAKNNYGFSNLPAEIRITDKPIMGDERVLAFTSPLGDIDIRSTINHNDIIDTIHHELRHLKQRQYAFNLSPEEYVKFNQPQNMTIPQEVFEYALGGKANISNIPPQYIEFAKNSSKGILSYCSVENSEAGYLAQWVEQDAIKAGGLVKNYFKVKH